MKTSARKLGPDCVGELHLVAGGKEVACEVPVIGWEASGLAFPGLRKRRATDLVTGHWTGGDGGAAQVHDTLTKAKVSVHFLIEPDGTAYQYCDADMLCAHAEGMNTRAVGIEMVNAAGDEARPGRQLLKETIRGVERVYTSFTAAQMHSWLALTKALTTHYGLPYDVPRTASGDVDPDELSAEALAAFRGVLGHYHWSPVKKKQDCGIAPLRAIAALQTGRRPVGPAE